MTDIYCRCQGRNDIDDDRRRILLSVVPRRTTSARIIMAVFQVGAATASMSYCAVCGAANAKPQNLRLSQKLDFQRDPQLSREYRSVMQGD